MDRIVGIDLGTSTSSLALVVDGEPVVAPDSRGNRVTPSYIHVMDDGRILVGPQAKNEVISDPFSTIWATKRLIGRRFDDPEVQKARQYFGYGITRAPDGGIKVKGRDKELDPVEVGAIILKYLTRIGKKAFGQDIKRAVITVPAYFTDPQRKATRESGAMIGLDVVKLINEPTAAALAYGYDQEKEQVIAIFDLGGGTFDLSILSIGQGVFEVIATEGDSWLGGEDFDNRLVDFLVAEFKQKYQIDVYNDKMAHQRVKDAAERTKIALSDKDEVEINLPALCPDLNRWAGIETVVTREHYDSLVGDLVERTISIFEGLLKEISMSCRDIDNVILVGGMTRMPLVRRRVEEFYGRRPDLSLNPDEAVAIGAAIHAAGLAGEKLLKSRKLVAAPFEATLPGAAAGLDATGPGVSTGQDLTTPGFPVPQPVTEPPPPPAPEPPPPSVPEPPARRATDFRGEPLPMDKKDADSSLPLDRDLMLNAPLAEAEIEPAGEEWSEEPTELPEAMPEPIELKPAGPAAADTQQYIPGSRAPEPGPSAASDLDDFFSPPAQSRGPAETPPPVIPPSPKPWVQSIRPAQTVETPFETDRARQEGPLPMPEGPEEEPLPLDSEPEAAFPDTEPIDFSTVTDELTAPEDPEPGTSAKAPAFDDHPVSAGPIIRDLGTEPAKASRPETPPPERKMVEPPVLLDVLSQTVGIAHFGGLFVPIVKRFSKLPARATQIFTTCADNQERIRITVLQGEGDYARDKTSLGEFVLEGIEKTRRGMPEIEVMFDIDQSGLFMVSAKDKHTGAAKEIRLTNWAGGRAEPEEREKGETK
jgi:molecular chaperone DnaK (HSP70)